MPAVNTRVSGTNVTSDWWGTSGIKGQPATTEFLCGKKQTAVLKAHKHVLLHVHHTVSYSGKHMKSLSTGQFATKTKTLNQT